MTAHPGQKNILLVSFDDAVAYWPYKTCFNLPLQTPNLDRICAESTAFHAAYCQAPICAPSRASFMSGKTPHELGLHTHDSKVFEHHPAEIMWPHRLKQEGYFCSSGGKVHHGFKPLPPEVHEVLYSDERKFFRVDWRLPLDRAQKSFGGRQGGASTTDPADDKRYHDNHAANSVLDFFETYDGDAPFYREVGFFGPHSPWITPARYKEQYVRRKLRKPAAWAEGYDRNPFADEMMPENMADRSEMWWKRTVQNYFGALSHTDYHLGRIWDGLKASRFAQDTVVIIVADHGYHLGERNRTGKTTLWERVAGVPLIVHDPAAPRAQVVTDPVALLDVGQTVMDYCEQPALEGCLGRSLRPYLEGYSDPGRTVPTFLAGNAAIRKDQYRFIRYEDGSTQLFDLEADPWELRDLGTGHAAHAGLLAELVRCSAEYGLDLTQAA